MIELLRSIQIKHSNLLTDSLKPYLSNSNENLFEFVRETFRGTLFYPDVSNESILYISLCDSDPVIRQIASAKFVEIIDSFEKSVAENVLIRMLDDDVIEIVQMALKIDLEFFIEKNLLLRKLAQLIYTDSSVKIDALRMSIKIDKEMSEEAFFSCLLPTANVFSPYID